MPSFTLPRRAAAILTALAIVTSSVFVSAPAFAEEVPPVDVIAPVEETSTPVEEEPEIPAGEEPESGADETPAPQSAARLAPEAPTNQECAAVETRVVSSVSQLNVLETRLGGSVQVNPNGLAVIWRSVTPPVGGPSSIPLYYSKAAWYYPTDFPLSQLGSPSIDFASQQRDGASVGQNFTVAVNGQWVGNIVAEPGIPDYWTTFEIPGFVNPAGTPSYRKAVGTIDQFLAAYFAAGITDVKVIAIGGSGGSGSQGNGIVYSQTAGCIKLVFKAPNPPTSKPTVITPVSGTATNTSTLNASWTAVEGATYYETRVATNAAMTEGVVGPFGPFGTSLESQVAEGTFWFQARGVNADGPGPWSDASKFTTDTTGPHVTNEKQVYQTREGGRIAVTLTFSEPITFDTASAQGWNGSGTTWTKIYYSSRAATVTFKDAVGNPGTYLFTVDKTAPTVTGIQQVFQPRDGGRIAVTLNFSESIDPESLPQGWYGAGTIFTKVFYSTRDVTVPFADLVGNPGTYSFTVDATAPTLPASLSPNGWVLSSDAFSWAASTDASEPITYEIAVGNHPNLVGGAGTAMSSGFQSLGTTTSTSFAHTLPIGATFWQVRATDSVGNVSKWTAPVGVQVIGKPVLSSTASGTITGDLTVSWTAVNGIGGNDGYQVEYTLADDSVVVKTVSGLSDTQLASTTNQGAVSVRVRAIYAIGFTAGVPESKNGEWSNTLNFFRDSIGPVAPQPYNPSNGAEQNSSAPTLEWVAPLLVVDQAWDPVSFEVRTSRSPSNSAGVLDGAPVTTYTTATLSLGLLNQPEGWTWWQVRGVDEHGNKGSWSSIWSFGVDTVAPVVATLLAPTDGTITNTARPVMSWSAVEDGESYQVRISPTSATNGNGRLSDDGARTLSRTETLSERLPNGLGDGTVYWQVRATDNVGNVGAWSAPFSFTVDTTAPAQAVLTAPDSGVTTANDAPTLTWDAIEDAARYQVRVAQTDDTNARGRLNGTSAISLPATTNAFLALTNVPDGTVYWQVRAIDAAGNRGAWSTVWSFSVDTTAPDAVTLSAPGNGTTDVDGNLSFSWSAAEGDASYEFEVTSVTPSFTEGGSFTDLGIGSAATTTSTGVTTTAPNGVYSWHVRATDEFGNVGSWSEVWTVTVAIPAPVTPVVAPAAAIAATPLVLTPAPAAAATAPAPVADEELETEAPATEEEDLSTEAVDGTESETDVTADPSSSQADLSWIAWILAVIAAILAAIAALVIIRRRSISRP